MASQEAPLHSIHPKQRRDYYTEFIEGSRWLRKEHAASRALWFEELRVPDKKNRLFEFEMLLKGLICFGNPVNHPGPPLRGEPAVARAFKDELGIAREIVRRVIEVGRHLTPEKGKSLVFQRYLESIIGQDEARFKLIINSPYASKHIFNKVAVTRNVNDANLVCVRQLRTFRQGQPCKAEIDRHLALLLFF